MLTGAVVNALTDTRTGASIPSKFETTLNPNARERKGFGGQAPRFSDEAVVDQPGPGYYASNTGTSLLKKSDSISKKGYGNLASQTERFPIYSTVGGTRLSITPGPGAYVATGHPSGASEMRTSSFAGPVSTFSKYGGAGRRLDTANPFLATMPGPGSYAPEVSSTKGSRIVAGKAAFHSGTQRMATPASSRNKATVGPGSYQLPSAFGGSGQSQARGLPTAAFRSTTDRNAAGTKIVDSLSMGEMSGATPWERGGVSDFRAVEVRPGPGHYAPAPDVTAGHHPRTSGNFRTGNVDRFGVPLVPLRVNVVENPGPGSYNPPAQIQDKRKDPAIVRSVSSSFFMSNEARDKWNETSAATANVDPSKYKPARVGKKSFHLNVKGSWV